MPLVRISVFEDLAKERRRQLPQAVYDAMRTVLPIPEGDLFVVLTAHAEGEMVVDPHFMGVTRTKDFVLVQITFRHRPVEIKQKLYAEIASLLQQRAGIAPDDVMIVITENDLADWSFGRGEAQYVLHPPA
ncbi:MULTISPECIES: tautomerase family protein [Acidobacterium]|uniref:Tautomerase family protein n=1 Tax=Acidobacterium capsulatum (strain ATCC 51196 / DSM 11244 / BCRC 80197 / JCM 7670 / NBRC 15755 / NCIMB 13165 / 161) TaxID=240015 RepID=C1F200_ACIC5|nr:MULTISPECIES: tautomerase family protein [Acidobacterium]ACO33754.1 tautomerase family protein [Acidobacterium capsulatum ATCC 51196]HCT61278.1 tautomerase family protein [Acidobacterium sp.]